MTLTNSTLNSLTPAPRRRATLRYVLGSAIALFCLVNVYRSTTTLDFGSSHEYLGRADVRYKYEDSTSGWNGSIGKRNSKELALYEGLSRIKIPNPNDYPPYNKSVRGQLVPVPLWQRRLWAGLGNKT